MKKTIKIVITLALFFVLSCNDASNIKTTQEKEIARLNPTLRISIPQGSGDVFVNHKVFEIKNDSLYLIDKIIHFGAHNFVDCLWISDTTARYKLDNILIIELGNLISSIDTLGFHRPKGFYYPIGSPRFKIEAGINGKKLEGSISNCYRENIFKIVDFMNKCNPNGPIITYEKEKLIQLEKELSDSNRIDPFKL